jgi:hypothetical protein
MACNSHCHPERKRRISDGTKFFAFASVGTEFKSSTSSRIQSRVKTEDIRMKKNLIAVLLVCLTLCFAVITSAQDVSQADKDRTLAYLESTKKGVVEATKGLSEAQWNFKAGPDRWSIAQVMEHLAAAEDLLRDMDENKVMKSPAIALRDPVEVKKIDEGLAAALPDRSHKLSAPEPLKPTNRFGTPEAAEKHFLESRATTEQFLKSTPDLRIHAVDGPTGVKLDGYEWILLIAGHTERHTKQMLEVKANPNFPKS